MCCQKSFILRLFITLFVFTGIGFLVYAMLDDEHKRVIKYLLRQVKYLPDRYML